MWSLLVDYIISAMEHTYTLWQGCLTGAYTNNVKFKYNSVCGNIVDCNEFL